MASRGGRHHIGADFRGNFEQRVDAETEHAGIPDVIAGRHVALRSLEIWLLDECAHLIARSCRCRWWGERKATAQCDRRAHADIAEPGFRMGRADAERDQPAIVRECLCTLGIGDEGIDVADQVIGGQDQQHRVGADVFTRIQGGEHDGRCGVARDRFEQEWQLVEIGARMLRILVTGEEVIIATGHGQHLAAIGDAQGTVERFLQQRLAIAHAHERLRIRAARDRPEPRAGAAGKNYGYEHDSELQHRPRSRHTARRSSDSRGPCLSGIYRRHWIRACAGMTKRYLVKTAPPSALLRRGLWREGVVCGLIEYRRQTLVPIRQL